MAGYVGYSMSNNAVKAYDDGKLPLSKITRKELNKYNITISVEMFKWLCQYTNMIKPCEWHHTSKFYNETNFYDLAQASRKLAKLDLTPYEKKYKEWKNARKPKQKDTNVQYALVSYEELKGLGNKRKYVSFESYAVIFNGWAYLCSGEKKSIKGKRFRVVETFGVKPDEITSEFVSGILGIGNPSN